MRFILPLLFIFIFLPLPLQAEEFLKGQVVSIDGAKKEITIISKKGNRCLQGQRPPSPAPKPHERPEDKEPAPLTTIIIETPDMPPCVKPHAFIHAWGEWSQEDPNRFLARRIAGPGWRGGHDSTGVRSRLRKRCLMGDFPHRGPHKGPVPR